MVNNLDLTARRGDTLTIKLTFTENGVKVPIAGWIVWFTIKKNEDDSDANAKVQKKVTVHTDPDNGKTTILVTAAETDVLLGKYFCDIQYKDSGGVIKTPTTGTINFVRDITRSTS